MNSITSRDAARCCCRGIHGRNVLAGLDCFEILNLEASQVVHHLTTDSFATGTDLLRQCYRVSTLLLGILTETRNQQNCGRISCSRSKQTHHPSRWIRRCSPNCRLEPCNPDSHRRHRFLPGAAALARCLGNCQPV